MGAAKHDDRSYPRGFTPHDKDKVAQREAKLPERAIALENQVRYMANTIHQAYHQDSQVGWQECERPICSSAAAAVKP